MRRIARWVWVSLIVPSGVYAQAAAEYALKSSGGAVAQGSGPQYIAGCSVDSGLPACLGRTYPRATLVLIVIAALLFLRSVVNQFRSRPG